MSIEEFIGRSAIGKLRSYDAGDIIFAEGGEPKFYYQLIEGHVKLNNYDDDGKESIQSIVTKGSSVGEFLLFIDKRYPANAVAITHCQILRISKARFFKLLEDDPDLKMKMISNLADSIYLKFVMRQMLSIKDPAKKLRVLMDHLKGLQGDKAPFSFQVPLTRQQMASLTGLRVETTIRALKSMEKENVVRMVKRKIYY